MPGIVEMAKDALQLPVILGKPEGFTGIVDRVNDTAFAAPVGLMLENMTFASRERTPASDSLGQAVNKLKKTLRNFLP
jgi:cell division protein FtsA